MMNARKQRVCWVVASPLTIHFFLLGHIRNISKYYELTIVTNLIDGPASLDFGDSVRVVSLPFERQVSLYRDIVSLFRLFLFFLRERFDVVHTLSPKTGLLGMVAAWAARVPVRVHTFQGEVWITRKGLWRLLLKSLDKLMALCATHLLVVSRSEADFLSEQKIVAITEMEMLANGSICGVDLARFKPDSSWRAEVRKELSIGIDSRVIIFVGRFTVDKGILDLANAFSRAVVHHTDCYLLFVGPDEEAMRPVIERICASHRDRLRFVGHTKDPERYMAASDILCLPSYREGFGLVLIEAAAAGLPTIGSRIYGIRDAIIDQSTGLLFEPGDVSDLTTKLETLLNDRGLADKLGSSGRMRAVSDFSHVLLEAEMLAFYKRIVKESVLKNFSTL